MPLDLRVRDPPVVFWVPSSGYVALKKRKKSRDVPVMGWSEIEGVEAAVV
jgi:hypothetical protein